MMARLDTMATPETARHYYHVFRSSYFRGGAQYRVEKMGRKWWVKDWESNNGGLLPISFSTKREAMEYADKNFRAVVERLRERAGPLI